MSSSFLFVGGVRFTCRWSSPFLIAKSWNSFTRKEKVHIFCHEVHYTILVDRCVSSLLSEIMLLCLTMQCYNYATTTNALWKLFDAISQFQVVISIFDSIFTHPRTSLFLCLEVHFLERAFFSRSSLCFFLHMCRYCSASSGPLLVCVFITFVHTRVNFVRSTNMSW